MDASVGEEEDDDDDSLHHYSSIRLWKCPRSCTIWKNATKAPVHLDLQNDGVSKMDRCSSKLSDFLLLFFSLISLVSYVQSSNQGCSSYILLATTIGIRSGHARCFPNRSNVNDTTSLLTQSYDWPQLCSCFHKIDRNKNSIRNRYIIFLNWLHPAEILSIDLVASSSFPFVSLRLSKQTR